MKHLKTYEQNINYPKYIVWRRPSNYLMVFQILEISRNDYETNIKTIYGYPPLSPLLDETSIWVLTEELFNSKSNIYQSDDLQEIINELPILYDANKYNL